MLMKYVALGAPGLPGKVNILVRMAEDGTFTSEDGGWSGRFEPNGDMTGGLVHVEVTRATHPAALVWMSDTWPGGSNAQAIAKIEKAYAAQNGKPI